MSVTTVLRMFAGLTALLAAAGAPARAETPADPQELIERTTESRREYEQLRRQIRLSDERLKALEREVAALRKDNATVTAALIQAAKTEKKISEDIEEIEDRLTDLRERETGVRGSLRARRGLLAEVLAALQRMGLNPPPAVLVRPEDALASVRSAILLGAVVPEIRSETEMLAADLETLARIARSIADERDRLHARVVEQVEEKERLARLLEEKEALRRQSETVLIEERRRTEELVAKADSLQELIESMEAEIEAARKAEEERRKREEELSSMPVPRDNRLAPQQPFESLRKSLELPVAGRLLHRYGSIDEIGNRRSGDTVQTQSGAIVTAPSDGTVLYAGPFRSYGNLLILDVGTGYHVVMAGLGRLNVAQGQTVLAGEPVGAMEEVRLASASPGGTVSSPKLYVEFRKDGKPVDPGPWWAARVSGRTENDS